MATVVFKSRIDWWIWAVLAFSLAVVSVCFIGLPWWLTLIYGAGIVASFVIAVFGTWYAIDEEAEEMIVYQFFRPRRYPVGKIRDVRFTKGYLFIGCRFSIIDFISIRFAERSVLRSLLPLEISPRNREGFVSHLVDINPDISVD